MFLRRVTVTGFKSFANKTVLNLEPGITAVVGPNGSGKSNLADAVRWALGEQSKGRLRLADREEVVFAGTDKRARASYAEVLVTFDNEDGAFPLDLTEVEISRRLYRSGETDYRLAGRSVRLSDIQALLAKAGFGANTYAVIGQGMIDTFLLSSPAERKLLFDEAAGIRGPELGREAALRKLEHTAANLTRLRDIAAELAPRLAGLQNVMAAADAQRTLEAKIADLREAITLATVTHYTNLTKATTTRLALVAADHHRLRHEQARLERELATSRNQAAEAASKRSRLQGSLAAQEQARDRLGLELAQSRAELAGAERAASQLHELAARLADANAELGAGHARLSELEAELAANAESADRALQAVTAAGHAVAQAQAQLVALRRSTGDGSRDQYVDHALQILKTMALTLTKPNAEIEQIKLLVHKAGRLLSHATRSGASELLIDLKKAQKQLEAAMGKREIAVEHQTNLIITRRSLEIDLAHQEEAVARVKALVSELAAELSSLKSTTADLPKLKRQVTANETALASASRALEKQREQIAGLNQTSGGADSQAEFAAALERAKATAAGAEVEHAALKTQLAEAKTARVAALAQAESWGVTDPHRPPRRREPLEELEAGLVRAEAGLEAHTQARREQAVEYEAATSRQTELTTQIADLEVAQADLESVIAELDGLIRERFKTNFQALATQFSAYFSRLFGGGSASLELTETDAGDYGVVIKASPKGKRLAAIAALSGGERALAGVALLAAILRVNPSPFVVLDEIDAALDEANSGRLAGILDELQEHSQLIVITHNRQTMRAARVLFGVTMNEDHVSHLLSLRLDEATQLAAR